MDKIKIIVCAHKADSCTRDGGIYKAVQVGKNCNPTLDLGYTCDNEGDNISEKNPYYSEYTALYWGWKNLHNVEYSGLCHYRRYFDLDITDNNIEKVMGNNDMLVIKHTHTMLSKTERLRNLALATTYEDAVLFLDTLLTTYPNYKDAIMNYFFNSRFSIPYSMFIAKKEIYDKYCEFIFPVLFEMEKRMKPHGYSRQKRTLGYLGEYSLGLFIRCYNLKYKECALDGYGDASIKRSFKGKCIDVIRKTLFYCLDLFTHTVKDYKCDPALRVGLKQDGIELISLK